LATRVKKWVSGHAELKQYERNLIRLLNSQYVTDDLNVLAKCLRDNDNDIFHAKCDLETNQTFNYMRTVHGYDASGKGLMSSSDY
jgi:hypothetical protein